MFTRIVFIGCLLFAATALQAQSDVSVGEWDWSIEIPDQGAMTGTFAVTKDGDDHKMVISGPEGDSDVQELKIEDNKIVKGYIYYQGSRVDFDGTFSGDEYKGSITVDYNELPLTATRKKQ